MDGKFIEGYENKYMITKDGKVISLCDNKGNKRFKIIKPRIMKNGYLCVNLWKKCKVKTKKIHRLVAETYIPNNDNLPCVNHKDGNKLNNNVENLEWCTYSYNSKEVVRLGLFKPSENLPISKKGIESRNCKKVNQYDLQGNFIKQWEYIKLAKETLKIGGISACCKGKKKTAGGYIWKYVEKEE